MYISKRPAACEHQSQEHAATSSTLKHIYIYVCIYIYIYIPTYLHINIYTYMYVDVYVCIHITTYVSAL